MSALTEEVEFLRQREADVQERENNLQMIAEMIYLREPHHYPP